MKVLILDNYDSFTYNLVHYIDNVGKCDYDVIRNDKIELSEIKKYDKILLSPGPGIPVEAGILLDLIKEYASTKSILGVCLGHQAISEAFGGKLINMSTVYHGVATLMEIVDENDYLFKGLPYSFRAGRYHSWKVDKKSLPSDFEITVRDERDDIMAISHKKYDLKGVQFHPESILTERGQEIINNWINH
ncbi:MAG: aminodeoxychorismate/anthranilate synthase component II [Flavobacteriales bacterium]|nr:aminodeoxychorismate/anthranilate synthase component II [Flavobacteriales bacterium]